MSINHLFGTSDKKQSKKNRERVKVKEIGGRVQIQRMESTSGNISEGLSGGPVEERRNRPSKTTKDKIIVNKHV